MAKNQKLLSPKNNDYLLYICGPTVYNKSTIGNLKPIIVFDIFVRALKFLNNNVELIHNITDIDDKVIERALIEKTTEKKVSENYLKKYNDILKRVNIVSIDKKPQVTESLPMIIDFIKELEIKNLIYKTEQGMYFDTSKISNYGSVSNQKIDKQLFEESPFKKHPSDFAVWKTTTKGIKYQSPWGEGRPGWHTECAAFIYYLFNKKQITMHSGGVDLLFPHHENENAQFKGILGFDITKNWMHVGQINFNNQKMSKSLGNVIYAEDFLNKYGDNALRLLFLMTSIKSPVNISDEILNNNEDVLNKMIKAFKKSQLIAENNGFDKSIIEKIAIDITNFDFSSVRKTLFKLIKKINNDDEKAARVFTQIISLLGFSFEQFIISNDDKNMHKEWRKLLKEKHYSQADKIRDKLLKKGII